MNNETLVTVKEGILRGKKEKTENGHVFFSFVGIPFAKPPLGHLRFKAPQLPDRWDGIKDATEEGNQCLCKNMMTNINEGEIDCLYLNVFTPTLAQTIKSTSLKPVMVWIHGGGFICGSKNREMYGPEYLIEKDIVLVTINYRLGVLGFLRLKDPKLGVPGNAGLKDQVMALKWVQRNIEAFGGDPHNVTLFGESAGAAAVSYQMLSPMSKGLFHKAIIQSGVANSIWAEGHTDLAKVLLNCMGKTASSEAELLKILEAASRDELLEAQLKVPDEWKVSVQRYLSPTVETSTEEEKFLSDVPINIIRSGNYHKIPIVIGCTSNEGLLIKIIESNTKEDLTPKTNKEYVPYTFKLNAERKDEIGKKIKEFYYGNETPNNENRQCFFNFMSDVFFVRPMLDALENILKTSNENVFLYKFDVDSNLCGFKKLMNMQAYEGVCHGEDIWHLFKGFMTPEIAANSVESIAIERMTTWWTNFAKYSDPNSNSDNFLFPVRWPVATHVNMEYMNIGKDISVRTNYESKINNFWKAIEAECV